MIRNIVERTMEEHGMLAAKAPVLVAVSGGVDSMVLMHLLHEKGHPVTVVHVDHGLRGAASDADRRFVEDRCAALGISCLSTRVDAAALADTEGISIQMAARSLRYAWFRECMVRTGISVLATAHHRDDVVETLLLNVMRGVGVVGLGGILPVQDGIIRPLIHAERQQIEEHARAEGIAFREDASNTDPHYLRNRVRHELLPVMEGLAPGARRTIGRTALLLRELSALVAPILSKEAEAMRSPRGWWCAPLRISTHPHLLLGEMFRGHAVHPDVLSDVLRAVRHGSVGAEFVVGEQRVVVDREELMVVPQVDADTQEFLITEDLVLAENCPVRFTWDEPAAVRPPFTRDTVYFDADRLVFPLQLRPWRQGDRIRPLGMTGTKLVSDVLIDARVPQSDKQEVYVLCSGDQPIWVVGRVIGAEVVADASSRRVLRVGIR